jgi:hypothetical protein
MYEPTAPVATRIISILVETRPLDHTSFSPSASGRTHEIYDSHFISHITNDATLNLHDLVMAIA